MKIKDFKRICDSEDIGDLYFIIQAIFLLVTQELELSQSLLGAV